MIFYESLNIANRVVFCMTTRASSVSTNDIRTVLMSHDQYVEMKRWMDKTGEYLFLDFGVGLVVTNGVQAPEAVLPPIDMQIPLKDRLKKKAKPSLKKPEPRLYYSQLSR